MEGPDHVIGQTRESEHTMQTALETRGPIQGADNTRTTDHEDRRIQFKRQTASDNKERITRREGCTNEEYKRISEKTLSWRGNLMHGRTRTCEWTIRRIGTYDATALEPEGKYKERISRREGWVAPVAAGVVREVGHGRVCG